MFFQNDIVEMPFKIVVDPFNDNLPVFIRETDDLELRIENSVEYTVARYNSTTSFC